MSYLVLARKYRPQSFEDLVGQAHVAKTLANAIAQGRVAHAFLFTGVRGVGKTTSARLLAKCLNCLGADGKAQGPTAVPCQVCSACVEIAKGVDMDVQEIDAASYNGVDEVRRLQEGMGFRPARDRYKIYIVDEVHMLSNAAWNAFLKTLEEPPPHVKFVFATTEVHKVPVTILSRCQRYDFKLIPTSVVFERLAEVLAREGLQAEPAALSILAREAAGSMRDAMSLLDQVLAYGGESLTQETVTRVLGVASREVLHELARALVAGTGNGAPLLDIVDRVAEQGFDLVHFSRDFLRHLRDLVVAKVNEATPDDAWKRLLDLADDERADMIALARTASQDDLVRLYQGFSRSFDDIGRSSHPRATLEITLVRLARRPALLPLDELLVRLGELERRLATGTPPGPGGGGAGGGGAGGGGGGGGGRAKASPRFDPTAALDSHGPALRGAQSATPAEEPPSPEAPPGEAAAAAAPVAAPVAPALPRPVAASTRPATAPTRAQPTSARSPIDETFAAFATNAEAHHREQRELRERGEREPTPTTSASPSSARPAAPARTSARSRPAPRREEVDFSTFMPAESDLARDDADAAVPEAPQSEALPKARAVRPSDEVVAKVRAFVALVRAENPGLAAHLEHGGPLEASPARLVLAYERDAFSAVSVAQPEHAGLITRAARAVLGEAVEFTLDTSTPADALPFSLAGLDAEARRRALESARAAVASHPLVRKAIELFDADLRDVRLPQAAD